MQRITIVSPADLFEDVSKTTDKKTRLEKLKDYGTNNIVFRTYLFYAIRDDIVFDLPEGDPPYKECQVLDNEGLIYQEIRRMYIFIKGNVPNMSKLKKEVLFIQLLEALPPKEAKLLLAIKGKKLPKNFNKKEIFELFPEFKKEETAA